jgi:hypothetical protein
MKMRICLIAVLLIGGLLVANCADDASESTASDGTGRVTFALKDAPLSSLQSLTIDITRAVLHGVAGAPEFEVFPVAEGPASLTVELLDLEGLGQLLSSVEVPAGRYNKLTITYGNPQATDVADTPQVITQRQDFMIGQFRPHLIVTAGSEQSVLIDVDVRNSYHDMGGNQAFLTPLIQVATMPPTAAVPLQTFFATVLSTNAQEDSFTADAFNITGGGTPVPLGTVTVQCDPETVFDDGDGGITIGGVAAMLAVNDEVEIEGVLVEGVIHAGAVTLVTSGAAVQTSSMQFQTAALPAGRFSGTIMDVDTGASTVAVRVQWSVGAAYTPFTDVVVDVLASTQVRRGPTVLSLGDLTPGNFCHVRTDNVSGDAVSIEEAPSFITGTVVSANAGAGAGGANVIEFTPISVNRIPASTLAFVPSPLTVELPGGPLPPVGARFVVFAFFDGTAQLSLSLPTGAFLGVPPLPPMPPLSRMIGALEPSTTATVNASGEVEFSLLTFDVTTQTMQAFQVIVTSGADMTLYAAGGVVVLATAQDAADAINQHSGLIHVLGNAPPVGLDFTADLALDVYEIPAPILPPPPLMPAYDVALGIVSSTASLNAAGDIEFAMQTGMSAGPALQVTVSQHALIHLFSGGTLTSLTTAQAVAELNQPPEPRVQVVGTEVSGDFDAHVALNIFR